MGDATPTREASAASRLAGGAAYDARGTPPLPRLLQLAFDGLPVGILIWGEGARSVLYRNRAFADVWGFRSAEEQERLERSEDAGLLDACAARVAGDRRSQRAWQQLLRARDAGRAISVEIGLRDGRCLRSDARPLGGGSGPLVGRLCRFEEITDRKRSESLLLIGRDLAYALSAAHDLEPLLEATLDAVLHVDGIDCAGLYLVDEQTGNLNLAACRGHTPSFARAVATFAPGTPQAELCLAGRPHYTQCSSMAALSGTAGASPGLLERLRAVAVLPVLHGGRAIACLNAASRASGRIPAASRRALETIAGQIGGAIARAKAQEERRRSEHALRESEERMRVGLEGTGVGIWEWNVPAASFTFVRHWAEILGYPPEEIEDDLRAWENHVHPDDKASVTEAVAAHFEGRTPLFESEQRVRAKSGEWRWMLHRGRAVSRDEAGRPTRAVGMYLDITRQKGVEDELRRREQAERRLREQLLALHDAGIDLLQTRDTADLCRRAVDLARERLGFDRVGIWFRDREPGYVLGSFGTSEDGGLRDERGQRVEVLPGSPLARVLDGKERLLSVADAALHDDRGGVVGRGARILAAIWDGQEVVGAIVADNLFSGEPFTEDDGQVLALYAATVGHICLRQRMERIRLRAEELVEADRLKDEFLAMLSHELRNPLGAITNAVHLLAAPNADEGRRRHAQAIVDHQVGHMGRILDDLLDLSRVAAGKIQLRMARVSLPAAVAGAVDAVQPQLDERRHTLDLRLPEEPTYVHADPTRLEQILWNLLTNAARYTPPGGLIRVEMTRHAERAEVVVADNGLGIPPEFLPTVFEPFVQLRHNEGEAPRGLGIGLALVRRLADLHGASIHAYSAGLGMGSEFVLSMPVVPAGDSEAMPVAPVPAVAEAANRRVLIADDDREGAEVLADLITLWGHQVAVAHDGRAAAEMAGTWRPDVVLLDLSLPGIDGWEVARRIRLLPGSSQATLVALTGHARDQDRRRAAEVGIDHFLAKPADPVALHRLLQSEYVLSGAVEPPGRS